MALSFSQNLKCNKESRKTWRKQNRCKNMLKKHEGLEAVTDPTKYIFVGNGGLICGVQREMLLEIFNPYGKVKDIIMIPDKPYSFVIYEDEVQSEKAMEHINGMKFMLRNESTLYLCYVKDVPITEPIKMEFPPGLIMIEDVVSEVEEIELLHLIKFDLECSMKHRSVKHFGYEFNYSTNNVDKDKPLDEKIPDACQPFLQRLLTTGHITRIPDQLTVNHYLPGQGIPPHVDTHSAFEDEIISFSLGSQVIMDFYHPEERKKHLPVLLPRRSVIIMTEESRYLWRHGITPRKCDVIPIIDGDSNHITLSYREARTSFTFRCIRKTPCECAFIQHCDSQQSKIQLNTIKEEEASILENECVTKVYESIANHFSETRYRAWPLVAKFVESLPTGTIVIDAGCGNGKNMITKSNLLMKRRMAAVNEIIRILKSGGQALIYVWAFEQETSKGQSHYLNHKKASQKRESSELNAVTDPNNENQTESGIVNKLLPVHSNRTHFAQQDIFVPWHNATTGTVHKRFYHLFKEGEIETLVPESNAAIKKSYYDDGNWCILIEKVL